MLEEKDIEFLQAHFDERYKKLLDCSDDMAAAEKQHHSMDVRLAVIEHQQKLNNWLTGAIAGGIVALVIKIFLGG